MSFRNLQMSLKLVDSSTELRRRSELYSRGSVVADEIVGVAHSGDGTAFCQTAADFFRRAPDNLYVHEPT